MKCFREDNDFLLYLTHLRVLLEKFACALHAYCLMSNHVHLLLTPATPHGCAGLMRELSQRHAWYFNRKYQRTGTLWEGRFRSCLVESSRYVLACYRYIELNPVRAGLVDRPALYPWSSHGANIGLREDGLVTPHAEYMALATESRPRRNIYAGLVAEGNSASMLEAIRAATAGGYPLVSEGLKSSLELPGGRRMDRGRPGRPARRQGEEKSVPDPDLFSAGGAS